MYSDDVKAEAIDRLSGGRSFILCDGDYGSIIFPNDPEFPAIAPAKIEAMCEVVSKEKEIEVKYAPPPKPELEKQLEYLWYDLHNNSINKGGTFYNMMKPYMINKLEDNR